MKFRKIVSLTALVSFLLLIVTSVILYIVPHGRVAYWSEWRLWGLSKDQWSNLHLNLGLLLFIGVIFHIYYNWKAIISYLENHRKRLIIFTGESVIAIAISAVFILATHFGLPPCQWVLDLNESIKDSAGLRYGEPPFGHAELSSLETLARRMNMDLDEIETRLVSAGYRLESTGQTLLAVAKMNQVTPQKLYDVMSPAGSGRRGSGRRGGMAGRLPRIPRPGTGKRQLADLCAEFKLDAADMVNTLSDKSIEAAPELTLKQIAEKNKTTPDQLYEVIRLSVEQE